MDARLAADLDHAEERPDANQRARRGRDDREREDHHGRAGEQSRRERGDDHDGAEQHEAQDRQGDVGLLAGDHREQRAADERIRGQPFEDGSQGPRPAGLDRARGAARQEREDRQAGDDQQRVLEDGREHERRDQGHERGGDESAGRKHEVEAREVGLGGPIERQVTVDRDGQDEERAQLDDEQRQDRPSGGLDERQPEQGCGRGDEAVEDGQGRPPAGRERNDEAREVDRERADPDEGRGHEVGLEEVGGRGQEAGRHGGSHQPEGLASDRGRGRGGRLGNFGLHGHRLGRRRV